MRQRKFTSLLVALLVASALVFAGGEARAAFLYDLSNVTITSSGASATYAYTVRPNSVDIASYVDFEIPVEIDITKSDSYTFTVTNSSGGTVPVSISVYDNGVGDFGTKFGVGDLRYRVIKASWSAFTGDILFTLTFNKTWTSSRVFADQAQSANGVFLIKKGNGTNTISFQAPIPTVVDPPVIPPPVITIDSVYPNPLVMTETASGSVVLKPDSCARVDWSSDAGMFDITLNGTLIGTTTNKFTTVCPPAVGGTYQCTITAKAVGADGVTRTASDFTEVKVTPLVGVDTINLYADPQVISLGDCSRLTWTTPNATFAFISNIDGGSVTTTPGANDCVVVCPRENTTYRLTAMRWNGTTSFVENTVTLLPDRLAPTPNAVQTICIGDVQQGFNCGDPGAITFKILRDPVYGIMKNIYVCGDADYNSLVGSNCYPSPTSNENESALPELSGCCQFQPGAEKVLNCTNMSGTGLAECLILGMGSPHYAQGANGVLNKNYPYCRSGETAGRDSLGKIIECYTDAAKTIKHTD